MKKIIGGSLLLVGSRYHSIVAALSQCVPCVGLGWSHKYDTLFQDFGCESLLVQSGTTLEEVIGVLDVLIDQEGNSNHRLAIATRLKAMEKPHVKMWENVLHVLKSKL